MDKDPYAVALNSALAEIRKMCPDVGLSFIFTKDGAIVAGASETDEETMERMIQSFQRVAEKADTIGSLKAFRVKGRKGEVVLSSVDDMYLALTASKDADTTYLHSVAHAVTSTVLKLLETITPTPLQLAPSKQLVVDTLSGFFVGDSVQIDVEILEEWSELLGQESIDQIEIEAFGGEATRCKVKEINDSKLKGKGVIRIPEKVCKTLDVKKGELVNVQPAPT